MSDPVALPDLVAVPSDLSGLPEDGVVSALPDFLEGDGDVYGSEGLAVAKGLAEAEYRDVGRSVAKGLAEAEGRDVGGNGKRSDLPDLADDPVPDPAALPDLVVVISDVVSKPRKRKHLSRRRSHAI